MSRPASESTAAEVLTEAQLKQALQSLPDWEIVPANPVAEAGDARQALRKTLLFQHFRGAMAFLQTLVAPLDALDHHPLMVCEWREVCVSFTTWDVGHRLTELDVQGAETIERLYQAFVNQSRAAIPDAYGAKA